MFIVNRWNFGGDCLRENEVKLWKATECKTVLLDSGLCFHMQNKSTFYNDFIKTCINLKRQHVIAEALKQTSHKVLWKSPDSLTRTVHLFLNAWTLAWNVPHLYFIIKPKLHNVLVLVLLEPVNIINKMFPISLCTPTGFAFGCHRLIQKMHHQQNVLHSKHIIMVWAVILECIFCPPLFWQQ